MKIFALQVLLFSMLEANACLDSGINLESINYYAGINPFLNVAKLSDEWRRPKESKNADAPLPLTSDFYVREFPDNDDKAYSIVSVNFNNHSYGDTKFTLLFDGEGEINFHLGNPKVISRAKNRINVEFNKNTKVVGLAIKSVNASAPISNIRLLPTRISGKEEDNVFRDQFKSFVKPFAVIRFMDFQGINNSKEASWNHRRKVGQYGFGAVPLEEIIDLANKVKASPWLSVPHLAEDAYVAEMARYVHDHLDPELPVYVEYSNEVWNASFEQGRWAVEQAKIEGVSPERFYAVKAEHIHSIWIRTFGSERARVKRVLATQIVNEWRTQEMLSTFDKPGAHFDILAVNYYVGGVLGSPEMAEETISMDNGQLFKFLKEEELPRLRSSLKKQKMLAESHGLDLAAYEAGQHIVAHGYSEKLGGQLVDNAALTEKLVSLNRDERIADLYNEMIKIWQEEGGGIINWFALTGRYGKWGSWGILDVNNPSKTGSPKYHAILENTCAK